ncbi:hypothetical protein, partial [Roseibium sp. RKSG952]|uniref:hypothetical protein n=1 Tax=Roseibium sp. RKSG952 TaxID=2529384 RepID=UPI001AD8AADA
MKAEIDERSFAHIVDRGGLRRTHLRGRDNVQKHCLLHDAEYNLSLLMRKTIGYETARGAGSGGYGVIFLLFRTEHTARTTLSGQIGFQSENIRAAVILAITEPKPGRSTFSTGCYAAKSWGGRK